MYNKCFSYQKKYNNCSVSGFQVRADTAQLMDDWLIDKEFTSRKTLIKIESSAELVNSTSTSQAQEGDE